MSRKLAQQLPKLVDHRYAARAQRRSISRNLPQYIPVSSFSAEHNIHRIKICCVMQCPDRTHHGFWEGRELLPVFE